MLLEEEEEESLFFPDPVEAAGDGAPSLPLPFLKGLALPEEEEDCWGEDCCCWASALSCFS